MLKRTKKHAATLALAITLFVAASSSNLIGLNNSGCSTEGSGQCATQVDNQ